MTQQLAAGTAKVPITPPLGVSMAGYYHDRRADDVLDDLHARALVLTSGDTAAALVVCDLIGLTRDLADRVRAMAAERNSIPPEQIMVCCTHTHTGPILRDWSEAGMVADPAYLDVLTRKIADAVQLAHRRQQPASIRAGTGHVEGIAFNRRYWMADGSLRTNPPFQSPAIVRAAGPIDPELGLVLLEDGGQQPLAMVNTYALHPDQVGGAALSADFQGVEARMLESVLGNGAVVLCPNGCCGDINHFDVFKPAARSKGPRAARRSGMALAGETLKQLSTLESIVPATLRAGSRTIQAQIRVPTADEVLWAQTAVENEMRGFDSQGLDVVKAHRMLRIHVEGQTQLSLEVSAIAVGDVAIVGLPGEMFVELGLDLKARSPFPYTSVAELCNNAIGYVPTRRAYDEGGYEATSSPLAPGTGEQIVEAALLLLNELAADR